jgi:hypothetical protein
MVRIILNDDQIRQIKEANDSVVFVNSRGVPIVYGSTGFSPEEIQEALVRANSNGPWYTTEEVVRFIESQEAPA